MKSQLVFTKSVMRSVTVLLVSIALIGLPGCTDNNETGSSTLMKAAGMEKSAVIEIKPENFIDEFGWYVGFLDNTTEYNVLYNRNSNLFEVTEDVIGTPSVSVVCSGDGIGFVRCVRDWLIANPSKCLCICSDNDGYEATDGC